MAKSQGSAATDTKIYLGDGESPQGWDLIPEPKDIDGPEITPEFIDFTHQQSPGGFRERKPGLKSSGDVTFRCNYLYNNEVQDALFAAAQANPPTLKNFKMVFPDTTQILFSAYIGIRFTNPVNGPEEIAVTLSLEGDFTKS